MTIRGRFLFGAAILLLAGGLAAQNLVPNPSFDSGLSPWVNDDPVNQAVTFDPLDANGSSKSGSAHLVLTYPSGGVSSGIHSPCLAVPSASTFSIGAKIRVPSGQAQHGRAQARVDWYSDATCSGSPLSPPTGGPYISSPDEWLESSVSDWAPPAGAVAAIFHVYNIKDDAGGSFEIFVDDVFLVPGSVTGPCVTDAHTLCLHGGRFQVTAAFRTPSDSTLKLGTAGILSDDTGDFWFFSSTNIELIVKAVAACTDPFNRYWVFAAGLTNVEVTLTVVDTTSGQVRTYVNPQGTAYAPVQDTGAFATCP
jgi:hypothetical protein